MLSRRQASDGVAEGSGVRIERDSLGPVEVPQGVLYGAHTARAIENFAVSGDTVSNYPDLLVALAAVKIAAARANIDAGVLPSDIGEAIVTAGREVVGGRWHDQFPMDLVQGGGGTATNMSMNEVLANRANVLLGGALGHYRPTHPNDHVNRSQSTNDVYPTAASVASVMVGGRTIQQLIQLEACCAEQAELARTAVRLGRTCLQDAIVVPVAATHGALASALRRTREQLQMSLQGLLNVPLGATAVGTGMGAPPGYRAHAIAHLASETGLGIEAAGDPFDALRHLDGFVAVAQAASRSAIVLRQSAADLRVLASGPRGGLSEVRLPSVQVGSSFMPGKVNPVIPELVMQVSFEIQAAAHTVELAAAAGELELNVMEPVALRSVLGSLRDLGNVAQTYGERCIAGLRWNADAIDRHLQGSLEDAVRLAKARGYAFAARQQGVEEGPGESP
jgi:aspartate ammonia-lyase